MNQYLVGLTFKGSFMEFYSIVFGKAPVKNQYGKFWSTLFYSRVPHVHTYYSNYNNWVIGTLNLPLNLTLTHVVTLYYPVLS